AGRCGRGAGAVGATGAGRPGPRALPRAPAPGRGGTRTLGRRRTRLRTRRLVRRRAGGARLSRRLGFARGGGKDAIGRVRRARRAQAERLRMATEVERDRKSTRLNSSHVKISYAVFCLKKKK